MKAKELKMFKEMLTKERDKTSKGLDEKEKNSIGKSLKDSSGEVSSHKVHMADLASDNAEEDTSLDLLSSEEKLLKQIQNGLKRIEKKDYGKCTQCGQDISMKRLKAIPYAELCHICQEKEEQG